MAQLMLLPLTLSCFSTIQIGFTFLVPAHLGSPGKRAVKWVCVPVCVCGGRYNECGSVLLSGESVDDCGGGYSESIAEMCDELQNGSVAILIQTPNGRDEAGSNRDCFLLNPTLKSTLHQNMFRFFGES